MKIQNIWIKTIAIITFVIFVFCCVLFAFLPHLHDCTGAECQTCAIVKATIEAFGILAILSLAFFATVIVNLCIENYNSDFSMRESSLVGKKVKLSD